jgi:hypothetical protein
MSRGQEGQIFDTSTQQNATAANNAQTSYNQAQTGVQDYENQLSQFAAANPYTQGGQFQTSQNQVLANTADAASQAAGQTLQGAAVRSGGNPASAIAATEAMQQQNTRNLGSEEASQNASRIANQAGYNEKTLQASSLPASLETALTGQQLGEENNSLNTGQKAGETPSFLESLMNGALQAGGQFAAGYGKSVCWIAARVFGGWDDYRTQLVRLWLHEEFGKSWYGELLVRLYIAHGEWIAEQIMPRYKRVDRFFAWLFEKALAHAEAWLATAPGRRAVEQSAQFISEAL